MTNFETSPVVQPNIVVAGSGFKFNLKAGIIILVILMVVLELAWLYLSFSSKSSEKDSVVPLVSEPRQPVKMMLVSAKDSYLIGEKVSVLINLAAGKAKVDGVDAYLSYDPQILEATSTAIVKTNLFPEYPQAVVFPKEGKVRISAITDTKRGFGGEGTIAQIIFKAKKVGKTEVKLDFTAGSTTDSNVVDAQSSDDLLEKVENLNLMISEK